MLFRSHPLFSLPLWVVDLGSQGLENHGPWAKPSVWYGWKMRRLLYFQKVLQRQQHGCDPQSLKPPPSGLVQKGVTEPWSRRSPARSILWAEPLRPHQPSKACASRYPTPVPGGGQKTSTTPPSTLHRPGPREMEVGGTSGHPRLPAQPEAATSLRLLLGDVGPHLGLVPRGRP